MKEIEFTREIARLKREVGKKVLDMGGNAVLGFNIKFDLEGASGLVVRAYGTACRILRVSDEFPSIVSMAGILTKTATNNQEASKNTGLVNVYGRRGNFIIVSSITDVLENKDGAYDEYDVGHDDRPPPILSLLRQVSGGSGGVGGLGTTSATGDAMYLMQMLDFADDTAVVTSLMPFGPQGELKGGNIGAGRRWENNLLETAFVNPDGVGISGLDGNALLQSEVTLLSLTDFDPHVNMRLGGLVMARSVKFLGKLEATLTDQETREAAKAALPEPQLVPHALYSRHIARALHHTAVQVHRAH